MEQTNVSGVGSTALVQTSEEHKHNVQYIIRLESQVGRQIPRELIPSDRRLSELELNKLYFDWYNGGGVQSTTTQAPTTSDKPYEFTAEELTMFKYAMTMKGSTAYMSLDSALNASLATAADYMRRYNEHMRQAADTREKLMLMDNTKEMDLTAHIKTLAESGWYKYSPDLTRAHNSRHGNGSDMGIIFTTPNVVCRYFNTKANVEVAVEMGMFKVLYKPKRNQILCMPYDNNLNVQGYPHPHITSEGNVCWGNAADIHRNAMNACQPVDSFRALQIILQTYNSDSPYQNLSSFEAARKRIQGYRADSTVAFTGETCNFDGSHYECRGEFEFNLSDFPIDLNEGGDSGELLAGDEIDRWSDDDSEEFVKCKVWERINSNGQRSGYTYIRVYNSCYSGNFYMERIHI